MAEAGSQLEARLGDYGWNLGMAFQLVDDILDFTSSAKKLGKPVGNDLGEGKVTLPLILALESATPEERALVETVLRERAYHTVPLQTVLGLLEKYRGVEQARRRAIAFADKSREVISELPESPYKGALHSITELVVDRES